MKDYKRLTEKLDENFYVEDCRNCPKNWCCGQDDHYFMCREALQQRLGELEDKIEQGRMFEAPCKMGEVLYCVISDTDTWSEKTYHTIEACRVDEFSFFKGGGVLISAREINKGYGHNGHIGENLFFTFEEAEAKLQELRGGK